MREAWVRLCGTYQSKGGVIAKPEVRKVRSSRGGSVAYRSSLNPIHCQVLNELAELYFAIPIPRHQQANPLGDMLSAMFGGAAPTAPTPRRTLTPSQANNTPGLD